MTDQCRVLRCQNPPADVYVLEREPVQVSAAVCAEHLSALEAGAPRAVDVQGDGAEFGARHHVVVLMGDDVPG